MFDGRTLIEATGEGRDHAQALRLQRGDDAVVMAGIAGQHIGAHQQHAHRSACAARIGRQLIEPFDHPAVRARMVQADIRIVLRRHDRPCAAQGPARTVGVAIHQHAQQIGDVVLGAGQPVLQRQEIGTHILRRSRNEAQQRRKPAQHLHLTLPGRSVLRAALFARLAAQALQHRQRAGGFAGHAEFADPRQAHHLTGGHAAEHRIAMRLARRQGRQHGTYMVVEKQHGRHNDVGLGNVGMALRQRLIVRAPFIRRMHGQMQSGHFPAKRFLGSRERAAEVTVHRHHDHPDGGSVSGRNALWHRITSRS